MSLVLLPTSEGAWWRSRPGVLRYEATPLLQAPLVLTFHCTPKLNPPGPNELSPGPRGPHLPGLAQVPEERVLGTSSPRVKEEQGEEGQSEPSYSS